jgi:peptidylprolyl isomerase/peptidyl-prolyl cis-trans isomerase B (cyclophilin B)
MRFGPGRLAALLAAVLVVAAACGSSDDRVPVLDTSPTQPPKSQAPTTTIDNGKPEVSLPAELPTQLVITDLIEGTGEPAKKGDTLSVNYVGVRSADGTEFDNSYDRGQPYDVVLGAGGIIKGWDEGLIGVKAGGRRQLDIPADLAYGDQGAGDVIKPGDAISFVIDVLSITPAPVPPTLAPMADPADCPAPDGSSDKQTEFTAYPPTCIDITKGYTAQIETNMGPLTVELFPGQAPLAVNSFVTLTGYHFFDGMSCHRIIPGFVAQCGDPTGTGSGGPGYEFADELPEAGQYQIGSLAMANSGPDTNGSQFFIITGANGAALPPNYTLFGQVTEGLDTTLPKIDAAGNPEDNGVPPLKPVTIKTVTITQTATPAAPPTTTTTTTAPATTAPASTVAPTTTTG